MRSTSERGSLSLRDLKEAHSVTVSSKAAKEMPTLLPSLSALTQPKFHAKAGVDRFSLTVTRRFSTPNGPIPFPLRELHT